MQRDGTAALAAAHRVWARLEDVMNLIAAAAIFFLMFVGVFQVIGRTAFNTAIHGYIDYMEQASALFAFLGISYAQRVGAHIRMDLLLRGFSLRFMWAMELFAVLVALVIIVVLVDTTWENFLRAWQLGDSTIDIGLPIWPTKLLVPVVLAILCGAAGAADARLHAPGPPSRRRADRGAGDRDHRGAGPARDRGSAWPRGEAAMSMEPLTLGIIGCGLLIFLCVLGVRIAYAAAIIGAFGLAMLTGFGPGLRTAGVVPHASVVNYTLSVLPMFILIGYLAYYAGITQAAFEAARRWLGWMPGGLAIATVYAVAGFSAVSGANTAAAAVFAKVAIPEMLKAGYNKRLAAGVVAAGATLDSLIPPSALLVIYGIITEQSVGKLLVAGFAPGIFSALVYTAIILVMCSRNPELGRPIKGYTWPQRFQSLPGTLPIVLVIGIIFYSMLFGWATPTEAGALGALCVFVIALANKMKWPELRGALLETARLTAVIFTVVWGVLIFVRFLGFAGLPEELARWVTGLNVAPIYILLSIYLIYLILGTILEGVGMFLLTLPVVFPVIEALGYDPIWFGIILVKLNGIATLSPPVGLVVFVVNGVRPDISVADIFRGIWPFIIADIITIACLTAWPEIVTFILDAAT